MIEILFRHRTEVLHEIALRLRELNVFPPFRANVTYLCLVNIFSNYLLYSTLEFLTTALMPVRGRKHLVRKRKAAIALEVKVPRPLKSAVVENGAEIGRDRLQQGARCRNMANAISEAFT